jgi:hypothetical protein
MVTAEDVRRLAMSLPRTEEALVRDQVKFRVGLRELVVDSWRMCVPKKVAASYDGS